MKARQVVVLEPFKVGVREVELPPPAANQILVAAEVSAVSAGTELAVYTGTHQWLKDPTLPDWKFPFRSGYSAAGTVVAVGSEIPGWKPGDRVSFPGNHASHELLTIGHERGRLWRLPDNLEMEKASVACIARYGMGAAVRAGLTLGRSAAVLGLGIIGQFALRLSSGRRVESGGWNRFGPHAPSRRPWRPVPITSSIPAPGDVKQLLSAALGTRGAEIVADATGVPDAIPLAMSLACDAGQVVVVGSPRGKAKEVNFYDDLHRRYIEVTGAHGNMLFEPAHTRLAGAWDIDKAQRLAAGVPGERPAVAGGADHPPHRAGRAGRGLRGAAQEEG